MKENDLQEIWKRSHASGYLSLKHFNWLETSVSKSHSQIISKVLNEIKLKVAVYAISLLTLLGLCGYAFGYLQLIRSNELIIPFVIACMFLLYKLLAELNRYTVLNHRQDEYSILESTHFFLKKLNRISTVDFYLSFAICYSLSLSFLLAFFQNWGGMRYFVAKSHLSFLLFLFAGILLILPWLFKENFNHRYKRIRADLLRSLNYLNEEAN